MTRNEVAGGTAELTSTFDQYLALGRLVEGLYRDDLHREPEMEGLAGWMYHMRENNQDEAWIRARLLESDEYKALNAPLEQVTCVNARPPGFGQFAYQGQRWIWQGNFDSSLYKRFLEEGGDAIRPVLAERSSIIYDRNPRGYRMGQGVLQVFSMWSVNHFDPRRYGNRYYEQIPVLSSLLAEYRLRWMLNILTDLRQFGWSDRDAHRHVDACAEAADGVPNIFLSLGNEYPQNGFDPSRFARPNRRVVISRGSNVGDERPPYPTWDYIEPHLTRKYPKMYKDAMGADIVDTNQNEGKPIVQAEMRGFAETPRGESRSNDPALAWNLGCLCALNAGGTFLSDLGHASQPWAGTNQEVCARSFFRAQTVATRP